MGTATTNNSSAAMNKATPPLRCAPEHSSATLPAPVTGSLHFARAQQRTAWARINPMLRGLPGGSSRPVDPHAHHDKVEHKAACVGHQLGPIGSGAEVGENGEQ